MVESSKRSYANGRIYCIRNHIDDDIYVGATTQTLSKRMQKHKSDAKRGRNMPVHCKMKVLGIENFYIELLEEYPCNNLEQLKAKEGEYIRAIATLNSRIAGRNTKDYHNENKSQIREQQTRYKQENEDTIKCYLQSYYSTNREKIREQQKQYYQSKNKEY